MAAWQLHDHTGKLIGSGNYIVKPEVTIHSIRKDTGISTKKASDEGLDLAFVLSEFRKDMDKAFFLISHNVSFDDR